MGGRRSKEKGKRGEREAAEAWGDVAPEAQREGFKQVRTGEDTPDVDWPGNPFWLEVKRHQRAMPMVALRQAIEQTDGRIPVGMTRGDRGEWTVHLRLEDFKRIVRGLV